jgi:3-methyladenine DNA glycosylase/8-oxoguanine DNA glycosylase
VPAVPDPATLADLEPALLALPGIGPWTVASAFLWGIAHPDAFPRGDVALLRAVRRNFRDDTLDMKSMERLSEAWRPFRGEAARLLWLDLLGPATEGRG